MSNSFKAACIKFLQELNVDEIDYSTSDSLIVKNNSLILTIFLVSYSSQIKTPPSPSVDFKEVILFEDLWNAHPEIIKSRLKNKLGLNQTIAGRACKLVSLTKPEAEVFFEANHLQGNSSSGIRYGLTYKSELVAAIAFSKSRVMVDSEVYYRSYELIKFANKNGFTAMGGLDKLLKHFIKEKHAQHIMTYIDLDWGDGKSFLKLGFKEMGGKDKMSFYVDPTTHRRYSQREFELLNPANNNLIKYLNNGSKKLVLDLR